MRTTNTDINAMSEIPLGPYCYTFMGRTERGYKIKLCPYWGRNTSQPEQMSGYCTLLGINDWTEGGSFLLWDQVKECGYRLGNEEDWPAVGK